MNKVIKFIFGAAFLSLALFLVFVFSENKASAECSVAETLRLGSRGSQVVCLQKYLNVGLVPDGIFGLKTKNAVIDFQKNKGLVADGIFGPKSRAASSIGISTLGNAILPSLPVGCNSLSGFSTMTGLPCKPLRLGCSSTLGFSTVTGFSCKTLVQSGIINAPHDAVISLSAIAGVDVPAGGVTPTSTIADTAQYTATISWAGNPVIFTGDTAYTATITITPKAGYTLTGVPADFFTVAGAIATNPIDTGVVTAVFPATPLIQLTISSPTLTTSKEYDGNNTAVVTAGTLSGVVGGDTVTVSAVSTYDTANVGTGKTITTVYTLGGADAAKYIKPVDEINTTGEITAIIISTAAIAGVTAPATGATPTATIADTAEYTATISWSGSPVTFASATIYTATITITPKAGYTLTGVPADFFTVAGATTTNSINSGVVSAVFPETTSIISTAAIAGVTAPVTGATPTATIADTAEYTATISWSGSPVTFASATVYTATITITPKAGYTLNGVPADFFTVAGATATNSAGAGVVSAVFPITKLALRVVQYKTTTAVNTGDMVATLDAPTTAGNLIVLVVQYSYGTDEKPYPNLPANFTVAQFGVDSTPSSTMKTMIGYRANAPSTSGFYIWDSQVINYAITVIEVADAFTSSPVDVSAYGANSGNSSFVWYNTSGPNNTTAANTILIVGGSIQSTSTSIDWNNQANRGKIKIYEGALGGLVTNGVAYSIQPTLGATTYVGDAVYSGTQSYNSGSIVAFKGYIDP